VRIAPSDLGLDRYPRLGALLQFSSPGSRACRESLNRLAATAAHSDGGLVVVELTVRRYAGLQARLGVRHTPTVCLVGGDGLVASRWGRAPERRELTRAVAVLAEPAGSWVGAGV